MLEALVFSHQIFLDVSATLPQLKIPTKKDFIPLSCTIQGRDAWLNEKRAQVRDLMARHAGIVRSNMGLAEAKNFLQIAGSQLEELYSVSEPNVAICELRNIVQVARLIVDQSIVRKENRGTFYNLDLEA